MKDYPTIVLTTEKPINGYWDGGAKQRFEFTAEAETNDKDGVFVKWGSFGANFWFHAGKGRTPKTAAAYAIRRLKHLLDYDGSIPFSISVKAEGK